MSSNDMRSELAQMDQPIPFRLYQQQCLYHPQAGFYSRCSGPNEGRDFITSVQLGSAFARLLAVAIDRWWIDVGRPERFGFADVGSASGQLLRQLTTLELECKPAIQWFSVEQSQWGRDQQVDLADKDVQVLDNLPSRRPFPGVVFANELLDNLAVDLLEFNRSGWRPVAVRVTDDGLKEQLLDAVSLPAYIAAPSPLAAGRVAVMTSARTWLHSAREVFAGGQVVAIDYCRSSEEMISTDWTQWLRTYRRHMPLASPYVSPGSADITCDVAIDQLQPDSVQSQNEFLGRLGAAALGREAAETWDHHAATGSLQALVARSLASEVAALTNPGGLGGFKVATWSIGAK